MHWWFWPVAVLFVLAYDAYFLWSSTPPSSIVSGRGGEGGRDGVGRGGSRADIEVEAEREGREGRSIIERVDPHENGPAGGEGQTSVSSSSQQGIRQHLAQMVTLTVNTVDATAGEITRQVSGSWVTLAFMSGAIDITVYFFQMAMLVMPGKPKA